MELRRLRFEPALLALVSLAACGGRTAPLDTTTAEDGAGAASSAPATPTPPRDAGVVAPDAQPEPPPGPCHLVAEGEPFRGVSFEEPGHSFLASGLLARQAGNRVVQYGAGLGIRTGVWQDPPIFAAEYDVSTWPPTAVHASTELFHSMHTPANLTELPDGSLGLSWYFDNDSPMGERGVRFRTMDATSWALQPDRWLVQDVTTWGRPQLGAAASLASVYRRQGVSEDGARFVYRDEVGFFGLDGSAQRTVPLWSFSAPGQSVSTSLLHGKSGTLLAAGFGTCDEIPAELCAAGGLVVYRVEEAGLQKVYEIESTDPRKAAASVALVGDGASHTWVTWWEVDVRDEAEDPTVSYLLAQRLGAAGTPTGPVERWLADDHTASVPQQGTSIGALGLVYPLRIAEKEGDAWSHELRLLHRQLEQDEPLETITLPIEAAGSIETVQLASPRALLVGYSISEPGSDVAHGEIRKYVCREDTP